MPYSRTKMRDAIEEFVLDERHRKLLHMKLVEGLTYEAAAAAASLFISIFISNLVRFEAAQSGFRGYTNVLMRKLTDK